MRKISDEVKDEMLEISKLHKVSVLLSVVIDIVCV